MGFHATPLGIEGGGPAAVHHGAPGTDALGRGAYRHRPAGTPGTLERIARRYTRLIEALPVAVVVLDGDGRVLECNPAARGLLDGLQAGALWRAEVARLFAPRADDGADVSLASGRRVNIVTCATGDGPGQILVLSDVTASRALSQARAELERHDALGHLAGSLAHQIRTPLAGAMLHAGALEAGAPVDAALRARLMGRLRLMERLVEDMLTFARQGALDLRPIRLEELLERVARGRPVEIGGARLRIETAEDLGATALHANPAALASAVDNLIANALQAAGEDGHVWLRAAAGAAGSVRLVVSDDGPGMAPEARARAFEPFFTTREGGTGLGLAIARAVVRAHHGEIAIEANPDGGCTVCIHLPASGPDHTKEDAP